MNRNLIIKQVEEFAVKNMEQHDGGHDWWHLHRVRNSSMYILHSEGTGDPFIVEVSALLHDIGDSKFKNGENSDTTIIIEGFLGALGMEKSIIADVIFINQNISFSKGQRPADVSKEFKIVQDADRLDAIGAIGIARAFNYGGFKNSMLYDPEGKHPSTIAHFHEKLLKLRDLMNTETGRKLAEERHTYLESFLIQFHREWNGPK